MAKRQTALLLQGGGALGAYELGVLRYMESQGELPVDVVAGVSIGAVNACVLVGARNGDPVGTLNEIWNRVAVPDSAFVPDQVERYLSLLGNPSLSRLRFDYWNFPYWTALYSPEPLKNMLEELVDFDILNRSLTNLLLSAVDLESGEIEIFDNREMQITVDHVIASLSIPPMFPPVEIGGKSYWDGGLFDNTPLGAIIDALHADAETRLVIVNLFPLKGKPPLDLPQVQDRMLEIIFSNKIEGDVKLLTTFNGLAELAAELDHALPKTSPIRKLDGFKTIKKIRLIEDPIVITNNMPEDLIATLDFSEKSIQARAKQGWADAETQFKKSRRRKAPV